MSLFRPMLGAPIADISKLRFPLIASYKLDGVRAIWVGKEFLSRTLKTIPNRALQAKFAALGIPSGWDGELIAGEPWASDCYRRTNSLVMTRDAPASEVRFFVFDNAAEDAPFVERIAGLRSIGDSVCALQQILVSSRDELLKLEERALTAGYEGLILRHPKGPYKHGRSTFNEHYMLKLKRFADAEARVVGFEELEINQNPATLDERGYVKRSSHQDGKVPAGRLGALVCELPDGRQFRIGTGFDEAERIEIWHKKESYLHRLVKFKYLPVGVKDLPRHPVFLGFRSEIDR